MKETVKVLEFEIPVGEPTIHVDFEKSREESIARRDSILLAFKQDMIDSLNQRRDACYKHLKSHLSTAEAVPYAEGVVSYTYPDGHGHTFNLSSYNLMEEAINVIFQEQWDMFLDNHAMVEQLLKGLLNQPFRPSEKKVDGKDVPFSDLVSLLIEAFGFAIVKKHCSDF